MTSRTGQAELTVVVPVLDRNQPLRRAVASALSQSDAVSVVIVDDGSGPEFAAVADEIARSAARAVQVVRQTNRGPAAARNAGLSRVSTPFVMFLDSDDELTDSALSLIERHLIRPEDVGLFSGAVQVVSPAGPMPTIYPDVLIGAPWARLGVLCGSFAVRTEIARAVGGYDEALGFGENTDLVLRLAEECRRRSLQIAATTEPLSIYRSALLDERRYDAKRLEAALHLLRRGRFDLEHPKARARLHAIAAVNAARVGHYGLSVKHAAHAALSEPGNPRHLARLALALSGPLARHRWLTSSPES